MTLRGLASNLPLALATILVLAVPPAGASADRDAASSTCPCAGTKSLDVAASPPAKADPPITREGTSASGPEQANENHASGRAESRKHEVPHGEGVARVDPIWGPGWDWDWDWDWGWGPPDYVHVAAPPGHEPVEFHVHPWTATLVVDGHGMGEARDYDSDWHPLWLEPGVHVIELEHGKFMTYRFTLNIERGQPYDLHFRLHHGSGIDPRSTSATTARTQSPDNSRRSG